MHACRFSLSLSLSLSHARIYSYHVLGCRFSLSYTKIHARAFSLTSHTHTHTTCCRVHVRGCGCVCVCAGVANTKAPASFLIAFYFSNFFLGRRRGDTKVAAAHLDSIFLVVCRRGGHKSSQCPNRPYLDSTCYRCGRAAGHSPYEW
jgi:hypothetical protein